MPKPVPYFSHHFKNAKASFEAAKNSLDVNLAIKHIATGLSHLCDDLDAEFKQVHWENATQKTVESKGGGV